MTISASSGTAGKPVLIFPGGTPRSLEFLQKCLREGQPVIGASSLAHDPSREKYPDWLFLPYITDPEFDGALQQIIASAGIGGIYSPNPVVWDRLQRMLGQLAPGVALLNESPASVELNAYRSARAQARAWLAAPLPLASATPTRESLPELELSALFRHAEVIPGMCDHEKIFALCEIARHSVAGDIVEIGSWWGKSAFVLARLAHCHAIGKLLCIDPWSNEHLVQHDEKGLVDHVSAQFDADEALAVFQINLLPYNRGHINYLRLPSTQAVERYRRHPQVSTESFGSVDYCGSIALLHIDGNHSYAAAKADIVGWAGLVAEGGWIVVDDYIWPYGDGPQRAGDELLMQHRQNISVAFVMGSALFIQLGSRLNSH